jgi:hypothetical protein
MVSYNFDTLDAPFLAIYALMGTLTTGIASFTLFDYDLTSNLFSVVGLDVSAALLIGFISLGAIAVFGEFSYTDADLPYRATVGAAAGVMIISAWVPEVNAAITGSDMLGLGAFVLYTAAGAVASYLG